MTHFNKSVNSNFSIQPNLSTRDKQLKAWARLILDYCQFNKIYSIDLEEIAKSELFNNKRLNSIFLQYEK
jgi:hypothetical protein